MAKRTCIYCHRKFLPSRYRPDQKVCSSPECQRRRSTEYHKKKLADDPVYREQCQDSQRKWRTKNPNYLKMYRIGRRRARLLKELHRLADLVKNNVAFDLRSSSAHIWIVGSKDLLTETNNLASAEVIVLQVIANTVVRAETEKNIPL